MAREPLKILLREDFKYEVSLPCPHSGEEVRKWLSKNRIPFIYSTFNVGKPSPTVEYIMTEESHASWFTLVWK
jgi:hypothetical protein